MRICIVDGNEVKSRDMLHNTLSESLDFPEWYGRNLDALYDCLTDVRDEVEIQLWNMDSLEKNLGNYAKVFVKVIHAAAGDNSKIRMEFKQE